MKVDRKTSPFVRIAFFGQLLVIFSIFPLQLVTAFPEAAIGKKIKIKKHFYTQHNTLS